MKMLKRWIALLLAAALLAGACPTALAGLIDPSVFLTVRDIRPDGTLIMNCTEEDVTRMGIDLGDVVTVYFGDRQVKMAVVSETDDVAPTRPFLALQGDRLLMGICGGNFAATYQVAEESFNLQGTILWTYLLPGGMNAPFHIVLTDPGSYLREYHLRRLKYTKRRSDFPDLTDAEFANFRVVSTTGMGKNRLYRSASPVNPLYNRDTYAMTCVEERGVTQALNLSDTQERMVAYDTYPSSWYAGMKTEALGLNMDYFGEGFRASLARGMRFLAQSPGATVIHCVEGKDRTGYVVGLLECLMGASVEELIQDYMLSFRNYYGLLPEDDRYYTLARDGLMTQLATAFELSRPEDLYTADLPAEAAEFLLGLGLTQEEIDSLKANLGKDRPFVDIKEGSWMEAPAVKAHELGLMAGVGNDRFDPKGLANRAQAVMVLWNLSGKPAAKIRAPFQDVPADAYYAGALNWAFNKGIVTGRTATTFDPDALITRQELAALLFRLKADNLTWGDNAIDWNDPSAWPEDPDSWLEVVSTPVDIEAVLRPFEDRDQISGYALSPMAWAVSNGLLQGRTATQLVPRATATRVEMAILFARVLEKQH